MIRVYSTSLNNLINFWVKETKTVMLGFEDDPRVFQSSKNQHDYMVLHWNHLTTKLIYHNNVFLHCNEHLGSLFVIEVLHSSYLIICASKNFSFLNTMCFAFKSPGLWIWTIPETCEWFLKLLLCNKRNETNI